MCELDVFEHGGWGGGGYLYAKGEEYTHDAVYGLGAVWDGIGTVGVGVHCGAYELEMVSAHGQSMEIWGGGSGKLRSVLDGRWVYVADHFTRIFYVHAIIIAMLFLLIILVFKETRGSVLLSRKASELNKWYEKREALGYYGCTILIAGKSHTQRIRWKVKADEERASLKIMIATSCYRPFALLLQDPTVFFFSLWISFSWAILYMLFSIIPYAFSTVYGFDLQQTGAVFASVSVASIVATVLSITQEKIAGKYGKLSSTPEGRLSFACYESAFLPLSLIHI